MGVLSKEDFKKAISQIVGDKTDDESLAFIENMTDTYNQLESNQVGEDMYTKAQYDELDSSWRKRYKERFESGETIPQSKQKEREDDDKSSIRIKDLFTIKK